MSLVIGSPDPDVIAELQRRLDHADANPVVFGARNGDQNTITVSHAMMAPLLRCDAYQGPEWEPLHKEMMRFSDMISGNYSGRWVRSILKAAEGAK